MLLILLATNIDVWLDLNKTTHDGSGMIEGIKN